MKVLVTGAAGFIGSFTASRFLGRGDEVVGLDNLNDYYAVTLKIARLERLQRQPRFRFVRLDLADQVQIAELMLVLHDTTEFSFKRDDIEAVGKTRINIAGTYRDGRLRHYTACAILMHLSLAVTSDGLPLGLTAIKFWSREKFKGANALKKKINPTRVPIEHKESIRWLDNVRQSSELLGDPSRCVHIGDRESDIYELFCMAKDQGAHFLLCTCVDRLAGREAEHPQGV